MKRFIFALALVIAASCSQTVKTDTDEQPLVTWDDPGITDHYYLDGDRFPLLSVTKVEFYGNETRLYAQLRYSSYGRKIKFSRRAFLDNGTGKYRILSADGIKLGRKLNMGETGIIDIVFHFEPLPLETERFSFTVGSNCDFLYIKEVLDPQIRYKNFFQSYWRNSKTGSWDITFYNDCIIYDSRFWTYDELPDIEKEVGEAVFTALNGDDVLTVEVGEFDNGKRTITINGVSDEYQMFNCQFIPEYPVKDERESFVDTGFSGIDTVTVTGWLRGWDNVFETAPEVSFICSDITSGSNGEITYAGKVDELGRFAVRVPVMNTTSFWCKTDVFMFQTVLEPGQDYFLMYDFGEGRHLFMGKDARLQNEMLKSKITWYVPRMEEGDMDFEAYLSSTEDNVNAGIKLLDSLVTANPNLSKRYYNYHKSKILADQASRLGETAFNSRPFILKDVIYDYLYEHFWKNPIKPYTLHRDFGYFLYVFMMSLDHKLENVQYDIREYVKNEEDLAVVDELQQKFEAVLALLETIDSTDFEAKDSLLQVYRTENEDLIARYSPIESIARQMHEINRNLKILDSLGTEPVLHDIVMSRYFLGQLNYLRTAFAPEIVDSVRKLVHNRIFVDKILENNSVYVALENNTFDGPVNMNDMDLTGISEGKELMDKLLEPHRGKVVLLDVWGTWCDPCKECLSHSAEEYAALSDYDVDYIYLACYSPEQSWKNVIREYNVVGDNVFHYNLPQEQQDAIQNYLSIHSFPTYKLFDKKGKLVRVHVDVRNLEDLKKHVKKVAENE